MKSTEEPTPGQRRGPGLVRRYGQLLMETIRGLLQRRPFRPFRVGTSRGETFVARGPHLVALLRSEFMIAQPNSDRRTFIPCLHVTTVETIENGGTRQPRRRRSR